MRMTRPGGELYEGSGGDAVEPVALPESQVPANERVDLVRADNKVVFLDLVVYELDRHAVVSFQDADALKTLGIVLPQ
jgi:hypothetical protein